MPAPRSSPPTPSTPTPSARPITAPRHLVARINRASAEIIREVADRYSARDGRPRWVAGALGPTNKTLSLSPNVNDPGLPRGRFRPGQGRLSRADRRAGRGRRRLHPDRDDLRHAERQGRDHGGARGGAGARPRAAADDLDDPDRSFRPQPFGPHGRGLLGVGPPCAAADDRPQLLVRRGAAAAASRRAGGGRGHAGDGLPERRPAQRAWRI